MLNSKNIFITGATGSIGGVLLEYITTNFKPNKIVVFSRDEYKQFLLKTKFKKFDYIDYIIGNIIDTSSFNPIHCDIDIVIHCAAMKHVTICEENPEMAIKTNVTGSLNVVNFALNKKADNVIFISTDKANNPNNTYGMTKGLGDKLCINANKYSSTKFSVIRLGNFFASRGSVVEVYKHKLANKEILPITHLDIARFFVTKTDLATFFLKVLKEMKGGEIFVPKMKCMKIKDIGLALDSSAKFKVIGLQNGEKFAELLYPDDETNLYHKDNIIAILPNDQVHEDFEKFDYENYKSEYYTLKQIKQILKK